MDTTKDTTMQHVTDAVIAEIKRIAEHPLKAPVIVRADTMLGVIMRLEAAEKERDALRAKIETAENDDAHQKALAASALRVAEGWERKCGELRAKVEAMERQEPVVEVQWAAGIPNGILDFISTDGYLPKLGDKLYTLPGAKGEEKWER